MKCNGEKLPNDRKKLEMISVEKNLRANDARGTKCKFVFFFCFRHHKMLIAFWVRFSSRSRETLFGQKVFEHVCDESGLDERVFRVKDCERCGEK